MTAENGPALKCLTEDDVGAADVCAGGTTRPLAEHQQIVDTVAIDVAGRSHDELPSESLAVFP